MLGHLAASELGIACSPRPRQWLHAAQRPVPPAGRRSDPRHTRSARAVAPSGASRSTPNSSLRVASARRRWNRKSSSARTVTCRRVCASPRRAGAAPGVLQGWLAPRPARRSPPPAHGGSRPDARQFRPGRAIAGTSVGSGKRSIRSGLAYVKTAAGEGLQHPRASSTLTASRTTVRLTPKASARSRSGGSAIAGSPGIALDQVDDLVNDSFIQALFALERCDLEKLGVHGWVLGQDRAKVVLEGVCMMVFHRTQK